MTAPTTGEPLVYGSVTVSPPGEPGSPAATVTREVTAPDSPPAQDGTTTPSPVPAADTAGTITIQTPGALQQGSPIGPTAQADAGPASGPQRTATQSAYFTQVFNGYAQLFNTGTSPAGGVGPGGTPSVNDRA